MEAPLVCVLPASISKQQMLAGSLLDEQCLSSSVLRVQVFRSCGNVKSVAAELKKSRLLDAHKVAK